MSDDARMLAAGPSMSPELTAALERIKGYVMSPAEIEAQRQSWVRAFAPCEHGEVDFETCPGCLAQARARDPQP